MADIMSRTTGPTRAERAHQALALALQQLTTTGARVPCTGDHRFISEDHRQRGTAAELCGACPLSIACHEAGRHEKFGIWAGIDRTPRAANAKENT